MMNEEQYQEHGKRILEAQAEVDKAKEAFHNAIGKAIDDGMTWAQLGRLVKVSRQAAWERFRKVRPDVRRVVKGE